MPLKKDQSKVCPRQRGRDYLIVKEGSDKHVVVSLEV